MQFIKKMYINMCNTMSDTTIRIKKYRKVKFKIAQ